MKPKYKLRSGLRSLITTLTLALSAPAAFGATETFNTAGTFDWVCPGGVTSVQVECWGGGGAGGAGRKDTTAGTNTSQNGGGGGGGAYARIASVPVTSGLTYTFTIPTAAVSGSAGTTTNGQGRVNGGNVTFVGDTGVTVTGAGGQGGANAYTAVNGTVGSGGGVGGTTAASAGDVGALFAGGAGSAGNTGPSSVSGSGGGGAGDANPGQAAVTTSGAVATPAGTTTPGAGGVAGGGNGGAGRDGGNTNPGVGAPGATPGGGGGGGHNQGISTRLGGAGGLGQVTLTYTTPPNFKANNEVALNDPSSWTAGFVPTGGIAEWEGTVLAANTTSLGADLTFSGVKISNPGGLVTVNSPGGFTLTLGAAAVDLDLSAATQDLTINSNLALGAANVWNVNTGRTLTLGGAVSGAFAVTKQGLGTVILSGASTYTGNTLVSGGTLNVTGTLTGNNTSSTLAYGGTAAKSVVNVSNNMTLFTATAATVANSSAVYNQTAGTVNLSPTAQAFLSTNGYSYLNLTGGTAKLNSGNFLLTNGANATGVAYVGGTGILDLNSTGGSNGGVTFAGNGTLTVGPGGTVLRTTGAAAFYFTAFANATGTLNVAGGNVDLGTGLLRMGNGAAIAGINGFVNLTGGTLTMGANTTNSALGANLYVNFGGGTLKASGTLNSPFSTSAGVTTVSTIFNGGLTVDTNGNSVTYGNALLGATGNGVKQANISVTGGSGYTGAPAVTFTGGTLVPNGTPASGYALINPSTGVVTGIVITAPGTYSTDPTVALTGGGGTGADVTLSALTANPADSGLTKTGSGALTLSGANTYTGGTLVSGGTLKFPTSVAAATNITVAGSAEAGVLVGVNDEQWTNTGDLTLQNTGAAVIDYGSTAPSVTIAPIKVTNFAINTNAGVRMISNPASALLVGQAYPLVTWTGSGPANGSGFASLTHRLTGNFSVNTPTKTLLFTVTSNTAGTPISWNTGNGTWDTSTVNWLDSSLASTKYFDTLDSVLFGDASGASGNPAITLGVSVSPVSVTMNSTAHNYTVSGAGSIGGSGALTLDSANTRSFTLSTANNSFTGGTAVNGGTLVLGHATNTLLDTGAVVVDGATAILSLGANSDTVGAVSLKNGASISGSGGTLTGSSYALQFGSVSAVLGGTSALTKSTTDTVILSGANTFSGATTIQGGTLRLANTGALASTSAIALNTASSTLEFGTDTPFTTLPLMTGGSGAFTYSIVSDRATSGAALNHQLGIINFGNATFSFTSGSNVASGTAGITFASAIMTSGAAGTSVLNPTSATLTITGGVTSQTNNFARTLELSGTGTGHSIGGVINQTVASALSLTKTGTSTWTLAGDNTYTGQTTVAGGTLTLTGNRTVAPTGVGFDVLAGSTLNIAGDLAMGASQMRAGNTGGGGTVGTINQTAGAVTYTSGNQMTIGTGGAGFQGIYNLSGGSITTASQANRGLLIANNANCDGIFNLSGTGVLDVVSGSSLQICRGENSAAANSTGSFIQTGGTATVSDLRMGGNTAVNNANQIATLDISAGSFSATAITALSGGNGSVSTINISGTAQVTLPEIPTTRGLDASATIKFDSGATGYLRPTASSATYMPASTFTSAKLTTNGAKFDTNSFDITIGQVLEDDTTLGTLTKLGAGTLTLTGANTYTGDTIVTGGVLAISGNSIADGNKLVINSGKVDLTGTETVATLFFGGIQQPAGSYTSADPSTNFTGAGTLIVTTGAGGGYDAWKAQITNGLNQRTDDADGDGFTNLQEFLFGTSPISGNGALVTTTTSGNNIVLRWLQRETGSTYTLKQSATLASGSWTTAAQTPALDGVQTGAPTDYDYYTATIPTGSGKLFFRIEGVEN